MDYFESENKQQELLKLLDRDISPRYVLLEIVRFIDLLLINSNLSLIEPFICELLPNLKILLQKYSPYGFKPEITKELLVSIKKISSIEEFYNYLPSLDLDIERIEFELEELQNMLLGVLGKIDSAEKAYFPIIEKSNKIDTNYGFLDSLQVTLVKKKHILQNDFLLHPSAIDTENRIKYQVEKSWKFAQFYLQQNYKIKNQTFQVIIKFDKPYAIYEGASLGIALTISFLTELFNYFDLREDLFFRGDVISTGEVEVDGAIPQMSDVIIGIKLEAVFYSKYSAFVLPKENEKLAMNLLNQLKNEYPKRELEIIGVKNVSDVINRRNLIELKKKNIIIWGTKKLIKNRAFTIMMIIFAVLFMTYFIFNKETNPNNIEFTKDKILIKNKFNEVLWYKDYLMTQKALQTVPSLDSLKSRIIDVDDDGINEVLITQLQDKIELFLFDSKGKEIWKYIHIDSVETKMEKFNGLFPIYGIIDTIHNKGVKELFIYFQHHNYYPSGITRVNLETGEQIGDVLWHPGSICGASILDWNEDGKKEILAGGVSNGLKRAIFFSINIDELEGTFPTVENYSFYYKNIAKFNIYLVFPQTDFSLHFFPKYNAVLGRFTTYLFNQLGVSVHEGKANLLEAEFGYSVRLDKNLRPIEIVIGDENVVLRDKLIDNGILQLPYTDTPEFHKSIKNGIEYWNGEKFVKYFEN